MKFCTRAIFFLSLTLSLVTFGCDKKEADEPAKAEATEKTDEAKPEAQAADKAEEPTKKTEKLAMVEVAKEGTKFDPPVEREQIPEGAWYCDMGTVHWASMEKPEDGRCPECHMMLKELGASANGDSDSAEADGEHDHAHTE